MSGTIKGKIVLQGQIQNLSPLHIGCGSGDRSDLDILLDENDKPFIPATSFCGVLHHAMALNKTDWKDNKHHYH